MNPAEADFSELRCGAVCLARCCLCCAHTCSGRCGCAHLAAPSPPPPWPRRRGCRSAGRRGCRAPRAQAQQQGARLGRRPLPKLLLRPRRRRSTAGGSWLSRAPGSPPRCVVRWWLLPLHSPRHCTRCGGLGRAGDLLVPCAGLAHTYIVHDAGDVLARDAVPSGHGYGRRRTRRSEPVRATQTHMRAMRRGGGRPAGLRAACCLSPSAAPRVHCRACRWHGGEGAPSF